MPRKGINFFLKTSSLYAGCQNFENSQFSFASSHKSDITYSLVVIKKIPEN